MKDVTLLLQKQQLSADPATPASGYSIIYPKTDGEWYVKNSAGVVRNISQDTARQVLANNVAASYTGGTTAQTVFSGTIPANVMGANGTLQMDFILSWTDNANTKTFRLRVNGSTVMQRTQTTGNAFRGSFRLTNRNATNAQINTTTSATMTIAPSGTAATITITNYSFDTTQALTIALEVQLGVSSDTATWETFNVLLVPSN
ncbi:hypothetical protein AHMF7605_11650 [Adhaeribacter arboris]|uniref:Uncharacterized protein n=1 Tax=Adhaeribacter arboris TaxID=2072846 RepID=A0A2T2YF29_9BACT|nr:hypothetical protein [Adhaeribacter arboris]PSR54126.1 hypothetical protein AHMF7605_11650 [Adhaeribacter arboris]